MQSKYENIVYDKFAQFWMDQFLNHSSYMHATVKPVYNDHLMGYLSAFWSSSRWPGAT